MACMQDTEVGEGDWEIFYRVTDRGEALSAATVTYFYIASVVADHQGYGKTTFDPD
jgi:hypothetical protein